MKRGNLYASGPIIRTVLAGAFWTYATCAGEVWTQYVRPRISRALITTGNRIK